MVAGRHSLYGQVGFQFDSRVDYLAGSPSRNAYVKTSIVPTSTMKIEAVVSCPVERPDGWFFNTESRFYNTMSSQTSGDCFGFGWNAPRINYGGGFSTQYEQPLPVGRRLKFEMQGGKAWIDEELFVDRSQAVLTATTWLPLFANHRASSVIEHANEGRRIHSFKVTEGGSVVADIIPVRKDGMGEMYDKVAGVFLERVGVLVFGPDVPLKGVS